MNMCNIFSSLLILCVRWQFGALQPIPAVWAVMGGVTHPKQVGSQYDNPHSHLQTETRRVARRDDLTCMYLESGRSQSTCKTPQWPSTRKGTSNLPAVSQRCQLKPCASLGKKMLIFD